MGLLKGLFAAAAGVVVIAAAASVIFDELSDRERRRQNRMRDEYRDYERRKYREYDDACRYYDNARREAREGYERAISEYNRALIEKRKKENRPVYDHMQEMLMEQYKEKQSLLNDCVQIRKLCEENLKKQQNTYVRFHSIQSTLLSLEEACYKLTAYLEYLDHYKERFQSTFEDSGEIEEPFSLTLPEDYPYEGKVMMLEKSDFRRFRYFFRDAGPIAIEKSDQPLFEQINGDQPLPVMMYRSGNGKSYLSISRGMLKASIGGTSGIDVEVKEIRPGSLHLKFMDNDFLRISISKNDLLSHRRKTPRGSSLHVYVKQYDFALHDVIKVSQKQAEGLSIADFDKIVLMQTAKENSDFLHYLEKNGWKNENNEWRIAPVWDSENPNCLAGIKMQKSNLYAIQTIFEELEPDKLVLRYKGILEKEDFVFSDDVYVASYVTLSARSKNQFASETSLFEQCYNLRLYLTNEFLTQRKILISSPMSIYLNQWQETTKRLIDVASYGASLMVTVSERSELRLGKKNCSTILRVEDPDKVRRFRERENKNGRFKFFISLQDEMNHKIFCSISDDEDEIVLKIAENISERELLERDFKLTLYSLAFAYAENQQLHALDAFSEGRVVNEKIKLAVLQIKDQKYEDNGYRITSLFNTGIQTNEAQVDAVLRAFSENRFFMIQGPPGTGKTTVIKELVLQQLARDTFARILIVSQANVAVDNVLRGIADITKTNQIVQRGQIVRCGSDDKIAEDIQDFSFENKYIEYIQKLEEDSLADDYTQSLRKKWLKMIRNKDNADVVGECLLGCFQIIGSTCVGLENRRYGLSSMEFDLVIVDEAGKALAGELLIPLNRAKKLILIGDHKQLPPVVHRDLYKNGRVDLDDVVEDEQRDDFLNKSFFQRLYEECPDNMKCMLRTQFRMPPVIADLVNIFYEGKLQTGSSCYDKKPIFLNHHLIFVDMKDNKKYVEVQDSLGNGEKTGPYNPEEVLAAKSIVEKIQQFYQGRIVIITPYRKQKAKLVEAFRGTNVWVNTIDAFQGDEEDIVIYCTTRARTITEYFSDNARLNVAFSRARNTLIFLGSSSYLKKYPEDHILRKVSGYLDENAYIIPYQQWQKDDFDLCYNEDYAKTDHTHTSHAEPLISLDKAEFFESVQETMIKKEHCACCGKELSDQEEILCSRCITKEGSTKCKSCHKLINYPLYDRFIAKKKIPELCDSCIEVPCDGCGASYYIKKEKYDEITQSGRQCFCHACINKFKSPYYWTCKSCGKQITSTYGYMMRLKKEGKAEPTLCKECKEKTYSNVVCKDCGKLFQISFGEKESLEQKGYALPKRCRECRRKR